MVNKSDLETQLLDGVVMNKYLVGVIESISSIASEGMLRSSNGERLKSLRMIKDKATYALDKATASEIFGKKKKVKK